VLGAAAKILGAQIIFLGAPGCWAPLKQQPWTAFFFPHRLLVFVLKMASTGKMRFSS